MLLSFDCGSWCIFLLLYTTRSTRVTIVFVYTIQRGHNVRNIHQGEKNNTKSDDDLSAHVYGEHDQGNGVGGVRGWSIKYVSLGWHASFILDFYFKVYIRSVVRRSGIVLDRDLGLEQLLNRSNKIHQKKHIHLHVFSNDMMVHAVRKATQQRWLDSNIFRSFHLQSLCVLAIHTYIYIMRVASKFLWHASAHICTHRIRFLKRTHTHTHTVSITIHIARGHASAHF